MDTVGEFVLAVESRGYGFASPPISLRLRRAGLLPEFADSISRVRRCCCQHPLPSELHGRPFDACSSSIQQRPCYETRLPHWTWGQPGRYWASAGYRDECRGGGGRTSMDHCDPADRSALPPAPVS